MQDQASMPQPMEAEPVQKAATSSAFGQGSGILGALSSNTLASKAPGSNIHRLGSKMAIPSAIDSSGLLDIASISRQPTKLSAAAASGACSDPVPMHMTPSQQVMQGLQLSDI